MCAAQSGIDSIKNIIAATTNDSTRFVNENEIGEMLLDQNPSEAAIHLVEAIRIAEKCEEESCNDLMFLRKSKPYVYINLGYYFELMGLADSALNQYSKAVLSASKNLDTVALAMSYNNLASVYTDAGEYSKALDFYFRALKLQELSGILPGQAASLNNIGYIYQTQEEYDLAVSFYSRSLSVKKQLEDYRGMGYSYNNIGFIFAKQNQIDSAFFYYQKSEEAWAEIEFHPGFTKLYMNMSDLHFSKKNYSAADSLLIKALYHSNVIGSDFSNNIIFNKRAYIKLEQNELDSALILGTHAYKYSKLSGYPMLTRDAAQLLTEVYSRKKNWGQAFLFQSEYHLMKDSLKNDEIQKSVITNQMSYEFGKKQMEDSLRREALAEIEQIEHKQEIAKKERFAYLGLVGFIIMLLICVLIYRNYRQKKKNHQIISQQNADLTLQKHIIEEKQKEIVDSITYAKRIQNAILPPQKKVHELLPDSFILYKPKDIVAGDFYWLETVLSSRASDSVLFAAADCTGHGVPGAMVSVVCNNALNRSVREYGLTIPGKILDRTREIVIDEFEKSEDEVKDGMDISLCSLVSSGASACPTLLWAGANNPLWILRKGGAEIEEIKADKQPIGKYAEAKPFTTHEIKLNAGDTIYIFTDGYQDQFGGEKGKKFKASSLKTLLISITGKSMVEQKKILLESFEKWCGSLDQIDDVCIIGVRV